jgi:hypothetical protein
VDWYPWGEEALQKARTEEKPILVSIGYAACHWCHVMERESFENDETAAIMNRYFINIKIDREERPDLDHIYMDAVQAMTGSGGWPLNVFLTPEGKPFFGGTYFPPVKAFNRNSWSEVLLGVAQAWRERRHEITAQADNLTEHISNSNAFGQRKAAQLTTDAFGFTADDLHSLYENCMKQADTEWGGFGRAPKFPQTFSIQYLLRHYHYTGESQALNQALLSLDKMIEGGIYDQLGGGFARYATDNEWLAPHFEKMLYDNALLVITMSEAYQLTGAQRYRDAIVQTMEFIEREMLSDEGGFYAALDADSEGVEGKYYVWTKAEIEAVLGEDAAVFCHYYDVSEQGNWEHVNILRVLQPAAAGDPVHEKLAALRKQLLAVRNARIRPLLDDKQLLGWNALMNTACSVAAGALGEARYAALAVRNMDFMLRCFADGDAFYHTYKNGEAKYPAFLDDYAYLVQSLIRLQELTGDTGYLRRAISITEYVQAHFAEADTGFFFYTHDGQQDVIVRKKEVYDGAVPSGNAVMAGNLWYLSLVCDRAAWREQVLRLLRLLGDAVLRYPTSFGVWAALLGAVVRGMAEVALVGEAHAKWRSDFLRAFVPDRVLMSGEAADADWPLLAGKIPENGKGIFLCKNYACQAPVNDVGEILGIITQKPLF